ncbi:MAG: hypothetical protein WCO78_00460 [Candidatus Roizmanbacteria bacterium]
MILKIRKPNPLWFKAKEYGWGWTPATWQGWLLLISYIAIEIYIYYGVDSSSRSASYVVLNYLPLSVVFTFVLILICFATGERPRWRWGKKNTIKT